MNFSTRKTIQVSIIGIFLFILALSLLHLYSKRDVFFNEPLPMDFLGQELDLPKTDPIQINTSVEPIENRTVVTFKEDATQEEINAYIESTGGEVTTRIDKLNSVTIKDGYTAESNSIIDEKADDYYISALQESFDPADFDGEASLGRELTLDEIETADYSSEPVEISSESLGIIAEPTFNDTDYSNQWALEALRLNEPLKEGINTSEKIIAVLDSGVCLEHSDIENRLVEGYDFVDNNTQPEDQFNHGCGVAGLIASNLNNDSGIVGAAPNTKIMPLKILDSNGIGTYSDLAEAIVYAVDNGAHIINISAGGLNNSALIESAVQYADANNITVVASAGNTGDERILYPAAIDSVISVGSVSRSLFVSSFSSRSESIDVFAPGDSVISTSINNQTTFYSGTSFASAYISSLIANDMYNPEVKTEVGVPTASGIILEVSFESPEHLGWGEQGEQTGEILEVSDNNEVTAQSGTSCTTRATWWNGAQCYIQGTLKVSPSPSYDYYVVAGGTTYYFTYGGISQYLHDVVKFNVQYTGAYSYYVTSFQTVNRRPIGFFDGAVTSNNKLYGWMFDPDTPNTSGTVHIYVGGAAGSGAPGYAVPANASRPDVNNAYGITGNHGYYWKIPYQFSGINKNYYVYNINTWSGGSNPGATGSPKNFTVGLYDFMPTAAQTTTLSSSPANYGMFLPQGYNADLLSELNQSASYATPHEIPEEPVNTATGFLDLQAIDLEYEDISGTAVEFRRSYNSESTYSGILGTGWQASFDMRIAPVYYEGDEAWVVYFPDGHGEVFKDIDQNYRTFENYFTAVNPESRGTLERQGDASNGEAFDFFYTDSQTGLRFNFEGDRTPSSSTPYLKIKSTSYPSGTKMNYSYSGNKIISATDDYGRSFTFTHDGSGRLLTVNDKESNQISYSYNINGRLETVTNPLSGVTTYLYDSNNRVISITDSNNNTKSFSYDSNNRVSSQTDARGKVTTYAYDTSAIPSVTTITDPNGNTTLHKHNADKHLEEKVDENGESTLYEYNTEGNRTKETFPDGRIYQFEYDSNGNRDKVIFPDGTINETEYNNFGKPTKVTEAKGTSEERVQEFSYESNGNIRSETDATNKRTAYGYNEDDLLASTTQGLTYEFAGNIFAGWDVTKTVKTSGDVNGDGLDDLVGYGEDHVYVALATGEPDLFTSPEIWYTGMTLNNGGWQKSKHPRMLADVNGDGKDDLYGFGGGAAFVALSNGSSFDTGSAWINTFGYNNGWRVDKHPRLAGDVNGDGKDDLIGVNGSAVLVALSNGSSFDQYSTWLIGDYSYNHGWRTDKHPRLSADINGDGKDDFIGFAGDNIKVSYSTGSSFQSGVEWKDHYTINKGGWTVASHMRELGDFDLDGKVDLIVAGGGATGYVPSLGSKLGELHVLSDQLDSNSGWENTNETRVIGDFTGNGILEILGFDNDGVHILSSSGTHKNISYNSDSYINKISDAATGEYQEFTTDSLGRNLTESDALGNTKTFVYDASGNVLSETDPNGNTTIFTYDTEGNILSKIDRTGIVTTYSYDSNYNVLTQTVNATRTTTFEYDDNENVIKQIDPNGNYKILSYDAKSRVSQTDSYDSSDTLLATTSTSYDSMDRKISETDPNGNVTNYTYDSDSGRLITESKDGKNRNYTYDFYGNKLSETDWEGNLTTYEFNKINQMKVAKHQIDIDEQTLGTRYSYDKNGNVTKMVDSVGNVTDQSYSATKRLLAATNGNGFTKSYTYDLAGRITSETNFAGETTSFEYDSNGNITKQTDNLGNFIIYTFDNENRKLTETDKRGNTTTLTYNAFGNILSRTDALNNAESFTYDSNGNMLSHTDRKGNVVSYTYDGLNREITETSNRRVGNSDETVTRSLSYDSNGNIISEVDFMGYTTSHNFDAWNNKVSTTNADSTVRQYSFDTNGNMLSETDENGEVTAYEYDVFGNETKKTDPELNESVTIYNNIGQKLEEIDAKGNSTYFENDALSNIVKVTDRNGNETDFSYGAENRLLEIEYPNGLVKTYSYDAIGQKLSETQSGTGLSSSLVTSYTYDQNGNILSETDANNNTTSYVYDALNREITVNKPLSISTSKSYDASGNIESETNQNGATTTFEYDSANQLIKSTDALAGVTEFQYNENGQQVKAINANGKQTIYSYDSRNRQVEIKNHGGTTVFTNSYDNAGNVLIVTDGNGNVTTYAYNGNNEITSVTDAANNSKIFVYDANSNLVSETNELGDSVTSTFDNLNRLLSRTNENGDTWTYTYDTAGNVLTQTDPDSQVISYEYNVLSRLTKETKTDSSLGNIETLYSYDSNGNEISITDPNGNVTTHTFDALNRKVATQNGELETTSFGFDLAGNIVSTTDALNNVTTYTYDALNRNVSKTDSANQTTTYTFDPVGNLLVTTDPNGNTQTSTFDSQNRALSQTDGEGNTTTYTYDVADNMVSKTEPNGTVYSYSYDSLNRQTSEIATPSGESAVTQWQKSFDSLGRVLTSTDAKNNVTSYEYDGTGNLTKVIDPLLNETTYSYDSLGNLLTETDANTNTITYAYNDVYNLISETDALGNVWTFEYDKAGNKTKETDAKGQVNTRNFDAANRIIAKEYLDGSNNPTAESIYYSYDNAGNLTTVQNSSLTNTFGYDSRRNISTATDSTGDSQNYGYDNAGNKNSVTYPNGENASYTFNGNNQVASISTSYTGDSYASTAPVNLTTTFEYGNNNQLTKQVNPDRSVIEKNYDGFNRTENVKNYIQTADGSGTEYITAEYSYTRDDNGNIATRNFYSNCDSTNTCGSSIVIETTDAYGYDSLNRVSSAMHSIGSSSTDTIGYSYTNTYTYDSVGNRTKLDQNISGTVTTSNYTYNANNQLLSDGSWNLTYDANGSRLTKTNTATTESVATTWNRANQAVQVVSNLKDDSGTLQTYDIGYSYDGLGRRIEKSIASTMLNGNTEYAEVISQSYNYEGASWDMLTESTNRNVNPNTEINYLLADTGMATPSQIGSSYTEDRSADSTVANWDAELVSGNDYLLTPDMVQQVAYYNRDALDSIVSQNNLQIRYAGNDSTGSMVANSTTLIENNNSIGNINVTNEFGEILEQTDSENIDTTPSSKSYSGQIFDIESETYYYGSRNYDPQTGTWTKLDVYRGEVQQPLSRHRYAFVLNNSVNEVDVYGYSIWGLAANLAWNYVAKPLLIETGINLYNNYQTEKVESYKEKYRATPTYLPEPIPSSLQIKPNQSKAQVIANIVISNTANIISDHIISSVNTGNIKAKQNLSYDYHNLVCWKLCVAETRNEGSVIFYGNLGEQLQMSPNPEIYSDPDPYSTFNPQRPEEPKDMTFSEKAHLALDVIGFVPVVGEAADAINAIWYLTEGNYTDALLSGISVIPMAGDAIGKGGKLAKYGLKYADEAIDTGHIISKGFKKSNKAIDAAKNGGKITKNTAKLDNANSTRKLVSEAVEGGSKKPDLNGQALFKNEHKGQTVWQMNDLNPDYVSPNQRLNPEGLSNRKLMDQGRAPLGNDDLPINLHHIDQTDIGGLVEMNQTFHQRNYRDLHKNTGQSPSNIDRYEFNVFRKDYWKSRF